MNELADFCWAANETMAPWGVAAALMAAAVGLVQSAFWLARAVFGIDALEADIRDLSARARLNGWLSK